MNYYRRQQEPTGCVFLALLIWLISAALVVGFWALVAYGIWTGIQYLQTH